MPTGCYSSQEAQELGITKPFPVEASPKQFLQDDVGDARLMLTPDPPNPALCPSHFPIFKKGLHWTLPSFSNSMTDPTKADCSQTLVSTLASKQVQVGTHSHNQHFCRPAFAFLSRIHFNIAVQIRWCASPSPFLKDNNNLSWVGVFRNNKKLRLYMSNCNTKLAFVLT